MTEACRLESRLLTVLEGDMLKDKHAVNKD
jgi:hypothetical protein